VKQTRRGNQAALAGRFGLNSSGPCAGLSYAWFHVAILFLFTGWVKKWAPNFYRYLFFAKYWPMNSFSGITGTFCREFAITQLLDIPPHLNCVATLPW